MNIRRFFASFTALVCLLFLGPLVLEQSSFAQEVDRTNRSIETELIAETSSAPSTTPPEASKISVGSPRQQIAVVGFRPRYLHLQVHPY